MPIDLEIPFDRVTYRDGQLLAAQDLRDDHRQVLRRQALHTHYLHETWGVALGFEVSVLEDLNKVAVDPGHAIDELGRDILLAKPVEVAVPSVEGRERFALTVHYQDDVAFRDRRELAAVCLGDGLNPRDERPAFSWRRPGEVRFGLEVPLASVDVEDGQVVDVEDSHVTEGSPDLRVRRNTRPFVRPHIGWGETEAGRSGWQFNNESFATDYGLSINVDTSDAGFTRTPLYFAQLIGNFSSPTESQHFVPFGQLAALSLGSLAHIVRASQTDFVLQVADVHTHVTDLEAEQRQWRVVWIGVEPATGCEPNLDLEIFRTHVGLLSQAVLNFCRMNY